MKTLNYKNTLLLAVLLVVIGIFSILWDKPWETYGSVRVGDQYQATSTPTVADRTNLCPARPTGMANSTTGILGSVNVLKTGAGELIIYDATTTNNNLRKNTATTSMILARFPTSPTAGSYHFDIEFKRGLLVDYTTTGTGVASTTISYRCEL